MLKFVLTVVAAGFIVGCAEAQEQSGPAANAGQAGDSTEAPRVYESEGRITANGRAIRYKVIAGETHLKNENGEPSASIFSTTYLAEGFSDPSTRPVAFIFNGGPGSASLWLHMGVFGPKRVDLPDGPDDDGAAPYDIVANPATILDVADLVFIDPVGTGWSDVLGDASTDEYWGVRQDAQSVREFIRRWLMEHKRWNSPKYLMGESYGTTRSGALLEALESGWTDIAINGVVLISSVLNFGLDATDAGNDVGFIGLMPSYAATAWYHDKVDKSRWEGDFQRFLDEARAFAIDDYIPTLLKGQLAPSQTQQEVAAKYAAFTGLSPSYVERSNMRISLSRFMRELLRDEGLSVGRLDSRFTGKEADRVSENPEYDPSAYGIDAAYTAAMLDYFTRDLGVEITEPYITLGGVRRWDWNAQDGGGQNSYVNVAPWIERAMRQNRSLRVLAANGYYDMATPFFGTELTLAQPGFDRDRLTITYYEAGHMMYIHEPSLELLSADVREFIQSE